MRLACVLLVTVLLAPLAGCVQPAAPEVDGAPDAAATLPAAVAPQVDAAATLATLKSFSEAYPYRQSGQPAHAADTYDTMVASAGDEATLRAGFQTVLDIVSPLLVYAASPAFTPDAETPEA